MSSIVSKIDPAAPDADAAPDQAVEATVATPRRTPSAARGDAGPRQRTPKGNGAGSQSRSRIRVAQGIYKDRWGLATTVKVNGIQREIRFEPGTPLKTIRARRDQLRASLRQQPRRRGGSFADDAVRPSRHAESRRPTPLTGPPAPRVTPHAVGIILHWTGVRPSQMGRLHSDDFRLDDAIPFVAVPRGKGGRLPGRGRSASCARLHGTGGFRSLVLPERQQGARAGGTLRPPTVLHGVCYSALVRSRIATHGDGHCRHSGLVRAYEPEHDDDLCTASTREAPGCNRAFARAGERSEGKRLAVLIPSP